MQLIQQLQEKLNFSQHRDLAGAKYSNPFKSSAGIVFENDCAIISIDVTFEVEKLRQIAKASVHVAGKVFHADASSEDMYQAVDGLVDKLDRQLKDHREKQTSH